MSDLLLTIQHYKKLKKVNPLTIQYLKSNDIRVISGSINGGSLLIVGKDSGINNLKDLVGKTVSITTKGSTVETQLRMLLKQEGLAVTNDETGVQIIARNKL